MILEYTSLHRIWEEGWCLLTVVLDGEQLLLVLTILWRHNRIMSRKGKIGPVLKHHSMKLWDHGSTVQYILTNIEMWSKFVYSILYILCTKWMKCVRSEEVVNISIFFSTTEWISIKFGSAYINRSQVNLNETPTVQYILYFMWN